jgi:hypothetical protein
MTDSVGASSSATAVWAGEGYSAFIAATATQDELKVSYLDADVAVKYSYTFNNPRAEGPSMSPSLYTPPIKTKSVEVSSNVVIISSGFAALAFILIAGGFYYEAKGRKKKRKTKKSGKGFMSYTLPGAAFTTKVVKKASKVKNSLRALASTRSPRNLEEAMNEHSVNKKSFGAADGNDEDANDHALMHGQGSIVLGTNNNNGSFTSPSSKRFKGENKGASHSTEHNSNSIEDTAGSNRRGASSHAAATWDEEAANSKSQQVPHTIISHLTSSTPIGVQRSKDGRIFEAIPDVANEHHKRARTSIF